MADNSIKLKTFRTAGAIGSLAARKREQLEQFNAEHRRLEEKRRKAREQLTNELNKIQTRERRRQRNQEQSDDKRIRFILGGLMLTALRSQGQEAFGVGPADLSRLKLTEFALLSEILARPVTEVRPKAKPRAGGGASGGAAVDVAL